MFKDVQLYQPIKVTEMMAPEKFLKYVLIKDRQLGLTPQEMVDDIRHDFYKSHEVSVSKEDLDRVWSAIEPKMRENEGLATFTLDFDGAKSSFFFPWLITIGKSPALALEMAYGSGYDLTGKWVDFGTEGDEIHYFVINDPTFVYHRERQLYIANLVKALRNADPHERSKVVDLGAGKIPWASHHGLILEPQKQDILAFDHDKAIGQRFFPKECTGITYYHDDIANVLWDHKCRGANLIILGGVASYYPLTIFEDSVVRPVYNLLKRGGVFFFDLQLDCPYYERSVAIFSWPKMRLATSSDKAIITIEEMRKVMWKKGMRFSAEYALDTYNEFPTSVMVTLTKI